MGNLLQWSCLIFHTSCLTPRYCAQKNSGSGGARLDKKQTKIKRRNLRTYAVRAPDVQTTTELMELLCRCTRKQKLTLSPLLLWQGKKSCNSTFFCRIWPQKRQKKKKKLLGIVRHQQHPPPKNEPVVLVRFVPRQIRETRPSNYYNLSCSQKKRELSPAQLCNNRRTLLL